MGMKTKMMLSDEEVKELYFFATSRVLSFKDKFTNGNAKEIFLENEEIILIASRWEGYVPKVLEDEGLEVLINKFQQLYEIVSI